MSPKTKAGLPPSAKDDNRSGYSCLEPRLAGDSSCRTSRLAHDQRWLDIIILAVLRLLCLRLKRVVERAKGSGRNFDSGQAQRGERRLRIGTELNVVIPDDRDVFGYAQATLMNCA